MAANQVGPPTVNGHRDVSVRRPMWPSGFFVDLPRCGFLGCRPSLVVSGRNFAKHPRKEVPCA